MNLRRQRRKVPMIPIVSLVDILVILLIFFIATTTFRNAKTHLKVSLPESKAMGGEAPQQERRIPITVTDDRKLFLDGDPVEPDDLAGALAALRNQKSEAKLELEADEETPLGMLVKIWDALRAAGYSVNEVPARIQRAAGQ